MQVELIIMADAAREILGTEHPYVAGSIAKYTARTNDAKKMRQMKVFGCRHCQCRNSEPARNNDHVWRKRFTFNGLVSHAKEKWVPGILLRWTSSKRAFSYYSRHKIFSLGDEDFFQDHLTVADAEHIYPEMVTLAVCTYSLLPF
jgi:hypothetical protein